MRIWKQREHVIITLLVGATQAKIDWNLEATFLQHLQ